MNRVSNVIKNTIVRSIAQLLSMVLSAIFLMYVTRRLGSTDFGKYTLAFSLTGLFVVIAEMGIHTLLTKEIAKKKSDTSLVFGNMLILKFLLTILFFILIVTSVYLLNYPREVSFIVYAMGVFVVTTSFFELFNSIFRGFEKMEYEALMMFLNRLVVTGSGIFALYMGYGLKGFVTSIVISNIISLLPVIGISFGKFLKPQMKADITLIKSIFKEAFPIGLMFLFTTINLKSGAVMLSLFKDYTAIGWYGAPLKLIESLIVFPLFFSTALFPVFTSLYNSVEDSLVRWYKNSFKILVILGMPASMIVTILADEFVLLLFGDGYANSTPVLQLLIWATFFISLNIMMSHFLIAVERQRLNIISHSICTFTTIVLNLLLIPQLSHIGAAISLLIGQILLFATSFYLIYNNFLIGLRR